MGKLLLIPSFIGSETPSMLPENSLTHLRATRHFIVEREKTARAFLKHIQHPLAQSEFQIYELNKHQNYNGYQEFFDEHIEESDIGVISEAGLPAIADPGSAIVKYAHDHQVEVVPLAGSSSIFLALMASGMNGQQFEFHGYLPIDATQKLQSLKRMEKSCMKRTQIFMETPYRNNAFLEFLLSKLHPTTRLCIACDLETPSQVIVSKLVSQWKKGNLDLHKRPCIFLIGR